MSDDQTIQPRPRADAKPVEAETHGHADPNLTTSQGASSGGLKVRCPNCHHAIEALDDTSLAEILCQACGSQFSLVADRTLDWQDGEGAPDRERPKIGQFELMERLGEGAFGAVWKARDMRLDRTVAVKIPRKGQLSRDETEQFLREARAAAQLQHPYVVSVHEVGLEDERIYIVSDFVAGISLDYWLLDQRPTLRETAELCSKIADALAHAHGQGVVHRDLKPSNIVVDASGDPHLMDFGLAKREAGEVTMTLEGQILGTPSYMSPEQARGESHKADPRTDVYSLGVILFELLTGERPFRGNVRMLLKQIVEDDPPSPRTLDARVPRDLETISLKCLEKEPHRRYPSAQEVGEELRRYLRGEAIRARPISRPARLARWCRRNPVVAFLSAAAVCLLVAVAVVSTAAYLRTSWALTERSEALKREGDQRQLAQDKEAEARKAQQEAENLATRLLVEQVDLLRRDRPLGWTWRGLEHLSEAVKLGGGELDRGELRSLAASCLSGVDFREVHEFAKNEASFCLAFSPDGKQLAIAQHKAQAYAFCKVTLVDLGDGAKRQFSYSPSLSWQLKSGVQDGGRALAFSPDGRWLVLGTRSGWAYRWDLEQERPTAASWQAHEEEIHDLAFSPDGKSLYSASNDETIARWEVGAGWKEGARRSGEGNMRLALSPDGSWLVTSDRETLHWRDPVTLERLGEASEDFASSAMRFCGGSRLIATTSGGELILVDGPTGTIITTLTDPELKVAHRADIRAIDVSPDGGLLVSADSEGRLKLWDLASERMLASTLIAPRDAVRPVFSPDGRHLAVTADRRVVFLELSDSTARSTIALQPGPLRAMACARDAPVLATVAGNDGHSGTICLWDAATGKPRGEWEVNPGFDPSTETSLSFHPSGNRLALGGDYQNLHLLDIEKSEVAWHFAHRTAEKFVWAPDGRTIWGIRNDCEIVGWDANTLQEALAWSNRMARTITGQATIHSLAVGANWLLAGSASVGAILLRADTARPESSWEGPGGPITAVALAADETLAALGTRRGAARLARVPSGEVVADLDAHRDQIQSLAFRPDGRLLATASRDGTVGLWRVYHESDERVEHLLTFRVDAGPPTALAFDADGNRLFVLIHGENALRVWHLDRLRARLSELGLDW